MNPTSRKFLSYYRPYLGLFIKVMLCALLVAGIALVFPLLVRHLTKTVLEQPSQQALQGLYETGALMVLLVVVQTACGYYFDYRGHAMGAMMETDMRAELFNHLQKLSFSFYDNQRVGQLMSRITNDLLSLTELYHHGPEDLVIYTVKFLGAFVILAWINVPLTLALFLFIPVMVVFALYFNKKLNRAMRANKERIADVNAQVEDTLAGIRVVKSFANEQVEGAKFGRENRRFLESRKSTYRHESYYFQGMTAFTQLMTVTVVVFGGISIVNAALDLADLITFLLYTGFLVEPIMKLSHITQQYQEGFTGFQRFMEIMEFHPDPEDNPQALVPKTVRGDLEFHDVGFRYESNPNFVLRHVSLQVPAGDYVALVGSSGVGKTTICSLIPRFYEVTEGAILLDGVDIRRISLDALRRSIGVVQQDVYLFAGTAAENIRYGRPEASDEDVIQAAKLANAHEFIMKLPQGYATDIGQRGVKLSGGQKQRLSIARVFLKNPPILIFDEATSSLDNESESVVQESLERLAVGRTTLVIAHRLSTIRSAKHIVVLTDGGIHEEGTHEILLNRNGTYARLYRMQFEL